MISSAKFLCASLTSESVINSKCCISEGTKQVYAIDSEEFLHAWKVTDSCIQR